MSSSPSLRFQHRIIDPEPPSDPHIKAAGDIDAALAQELGYDAGRIDALRQDGVIG